MTAALAGEAAGAEAGASGSAAESGGSSDSSSAPGNPLNAPGSPRRRKAARKRRDLNQLHTQEEREAELEARREEAAAKSDKEEEPKATPPAPPPTVVVGRMDPIHTGSGIVLGAIGWVLFMQYLQGGMPQVRRWLAAKALNKTGV